MDEVQKRNTALLISGRFISILGSGIQLVAISLYILEKTGSGALMGLFALVSLVPSLIISPFAGVFGDRLNRKKLMMLADFIRGILVALLALFTVDGFLSLLLLFSLQILISGMDSIFNAGSDGILPDLVPQGELHKVNAAKGGADALSMIAGPVLGGLLFGLWGMFPVFVINAASFIISGILEALLIYDKASVEKKGIGFAPFISDIRQVLTFISQRKGIKQLFTISMILNFLVPPAFYIILPYAVKQVIKFSSSQYGYFLTCFMSGILMGNIVTSVLFKRVRAEKLMKRGLIIQLILLIIQGFALFPFAEKFFGGPNWYYFSVIALILFCIGFFNTWINIPIQVNLQKMVPAKMRSRFYSILGFFTMAAMPLGSVIYGVMLESIMPHKIFITIAFLTLFISIYFMFTASREVYEPALSGNGDLSSDNEITI